MLGLLGYSLLGLCYLDCSGYHGIWIVRVIMVFGLFGLSWYLDCSGYGILVVKIMVFGFRTIMVFGFRTIMVFGLLGLLWYLGFRALWYLGC